MGTSNAVASGSGDSSRKALGANGEAEPSTAGILETGTGKTTHEHLGRGSVVAEGLESEAELDTLGEAKRASVHQVGIEKRELEITAGLENAHALLEAGLPLVFTVLAGDLEETVEFPSRHEVKLVVSKGKLGKTVDSNLAVVGRATDVGVGELTHGLGGDCVDLGIGVLEGAVPCPVASGLTAEVEDSSSITGDTILAGSHL